LIDFWGAFCGACVKVEPDLVALEEKYQNQGFAFVSIECVGYFNPEKLIEGLKKHNVHHNTLIEGRSLANQFGIKGYPTLFLLDRDGKIIYTHIGWFYKKELKERMISEIEKALSVPNN
jgi:thiol-disulfide isomerase/thioredoxin